MIELLSTIFNFVVDIVSLGVSIALDAVELAFSLLGGLLSLLMGLGGFVLAVVLVCVFIKRRKARKHQQQRIYVDADGEEFVSYYHQQEE